MPAVSCSELVDTYLSWLRTKFAVAEVNGVCEITTPFLDRHNDHLQIYVKRTEQGFTLTDDAYTISDLTTSGCDLTSPRRRELLTTIVNGFGVQVRDDDELVAETSLETFPQRKHAILQAMLAVNDMFVTAKPHVVSLFLEDVERFLLAHNIRYTPKVQFIGQSGFPHSFDFAIPASDSHPHRHLRAVNNPDRNSISAFLFAWGDVRHTRPADSRAYAVLNDLERNPSTDVVQALRHYDARPVFWSRREEYVAELAN